MESALRLPELTRLLVLGHHFEKLVRHGFIRDYAEIARLTGLSRARITQITRLRLLAPDIQEALLFLPAVGNGADPITERDMRPMAAEPDWKRQRRMWEKLTPWPLCWPLRP